MTFGSSMETVAILYDIENAPFEMLDYTLGKARKYLPCRMIVASDWESRSEQKCWSRLMRREGFTFRQIERKVDGKNSLDYALFDTAIMLRDEGVRKFFIITTDSDFIRIVQILREGNTEPYIIGVGTKQASQTLRDAYDEFLCYPPEKKKSVKETDSKKPVKEKLVKEKPAKEKTVKVDKAVKTAKKDRNETAETKIASQTAKNEKKERVSQSKAKKTAAIQKADTKTTDLTQGMVQIKLPKTLQRQLLQRAEAEAVDMNQLVTYLLMKGLSKDDF